MIETAPGGVYVEVHAQAGARRTRVVGRHGAALKMAVAAPPAGGKANHALIGAMAELLGVAPKDVSLLSGQRTRRKRFLVKGIDHQQAKVRIDAAILAAQAARSGR